MINNYFIKFRRFHGNGTEAVVTVDGTNCPANYTVPVPNILDPFTNQIGFGCRLTQLGLNDINTGFASNLLKTFEGRRENRLPGGSVRARIGCCDVAYTKSLYE